DPGAALAVSVPVRVVRLTEATRGLARHEHGSALLALARGFGDDGVGRDRLLEGSGRLGRRTLTLGHPGPAGLRAAGGGARRARTQAARTVARAALATLPALAARTARRRGLGRAARDGVALVDPDLDADPAERGTRLEEAVLDVGPQRVQRNATLAVELG